MTGSPQSSFSTLCSRTILSHLFNVDLTIITQIAFSVQHTVTVVHTVHVLHSMSSYRLARLDTKLPISAEFPSQRIQAFGFGEVGQVYLRFAANGTILRAEADLIGAQYKQMIIEDADILRIFCKRGETIIVNLLHPAAKFRLDPLEIIVDDEGELDMTSFDTAHLLDITGLPAAARYGWS
jgi:hypothetical protein